MNPNDAFNLIRPLGYDEAKRKLNQAFVRKLINAVDHGCGDIDAMRQAFLHGDDSEWGRLMRASMEIWEDEYGEDSEGKS